MEFVLIIIAVVVVSAISAAMKKKPKSSGEQGPPPRSTMSDIQRAFMMAAGLQNDETTPPTARPVPPYGQQQPGSYAPPYTTPAAPYTPPTAPYAEPSVPYAQMEPAAFAAPSVAESYTGPNDDSGVRPMAMESVNPFAGARVSSYYMDDENGGQMPQASPMRQQRTGVSAGIPLFEDQRDIVKAFIYAEILPRRNGAQRLR